MPIATQSCTDAQAATGADVDARAYALPPKAYFSQDWFEREMADLFGRTWTFAGVESDVANPGDYVTARAGYNLLAAIRGDDGELRAFHNICRHRGAQLLEGRGRTPRGVSCFYHRWHYNLDGSLRGVPQAEKFGCLDRAAHSLKPASVAAWNGLVFVHPDPAPPITLDQWLGDVSGRYGPWRPDHLIEADSFSHVVKANWKLFVENHIDGYHLFHLHAQSISGLDHQKQAWSPAGRHWTFYEPELPPTGEDAPKSGLAALPRLPGVDDSRTGSSVFLLFPNVGIAAGETYFAILTVEPLTAESCIVSVRAFISPAVVPVDASPEDAAAFVRGAANERKVRVAPSNPDGDFVGEDVYAAEALQRALRSPAFEVGPLARDLEDSIPFFQRSVMDFVDRG